MIWQTGPVTGPDQRTLLRRNIDLYDPIILAQQRPSAFPELIKAVILVESGFAPRSSAMPGPSG